MQKPLEVKNIEKSFGKHNVLDGISFDVKKGEVFGLIGLNGAGKTTLIKIILGLLSADKGSVSINNSPASNLATRKSYAYLPEKFHPSIYLKGKEFLSLTLSYYDKKYEHDEAEQLLEKLALNPEAIPQKMTKYSKGMGQKIGLGSAFLTQAPLLILDEPMSGLDPLARIALKRTIKDYVKQDRTVFFSSHILADIEEICDRIAIIHDSSLLFTGTPADFKKEQKKRKLEDAFLKSIAA